MKMVRHGLLILVLSAGLVTTAAAGEKPLRRILLISCDTLSASHLQTYGHDEQTAVVIDSLAARGVTFAHCLVPQVWTLSSHMSLFTSLEPGVHRVGRQSALPGSMPLLAESFAAADLATAGFITANHWLGKSFGFDRGFAHYDIYEMDELLYPLAMDWLGEWVPRAESDPFFLFMHYMDVHTRDISEQYPYQPCWPDFWSRPPAEQGVTEKYIITPLPGRSKGGTKRWNLASYPLEFLRDAYDDCIGSWERRRLEPLLTQMKIGGYLEDTLLIITADHGEEFKEHGRFLHNSPHVEVREVPLIMVWPGRLPAGRVIDERVSFMDLAPTLLDYAGLDPLPGAAGVSLRPLLQGKDGVAREYLIDGNHRDYKQEPTGFVASVDDRWWLLVTRNEVTDDAAGFAPDRVQLVEGLYDLDADPQETTNLKKDYPDMVSELRDRLDRKLAEEAAKAERMHERGEPQKIELSDDKKRKLKALGY